MNDNNPTKPLLSIIVPVYNMAQYLERCFDSLLQLPREFDYEIITVNDGSTDDSLSILRRYESSYPRVRVLDQPNQGVSAARNNALALALGRWVMFVDADDYVDPAALAEALEKTYRYTDSDIILTGMRRLSAAGDDHTDTLREHTYTRSELADLFLSTSNLVLGSPCCKFYRRTLLTDGNNGENGDAPFDSSMKCFEDAAFNMHLLARCERVTTLPEVFYSYIISVSQKYRGDSILPDIVKYNRAMTTLADTLPASPSTARMHSNISTHTAYIAMFATLTLYRAHNRPTHRLRRLRHYRTFLASHLGTDWPSSLYDGKSERFFKLIYKLPSIVFHIFLESLFFIRRGIGKL